MTYKECKPHVSMFNQTRPMELLLGALVTAYGVNLLQPREIFDVVSYKMMAELMTETRWGAVATIIGLLRIVAVLINGRVFYSPAIRAFIAFVTAIFWMFVGTLMTMSALRFGAVLPNGVVFYPVFFLAEGWCVISAAYEMMKNMILWNAVQKTERVRDVS